jgi:hypothetical protein
MGESDICFVKREEDVIGGRRERGREEEPRRKRTGKSKVSKRDGGG